jgi:hypothetical protein
VLASISPTAAASTVTAAAAAAAASDTATSTGAAAGKFTPAPWLVGKGIRHSPPTPSSVSSSATAASAASAASEPSLATRANAAAESLAAADRERQVQASLDAIQADLFAGIAMPIAPRSPLVKQTSCGDKLLSLLTVLLFAILTVLLVRKVKGWQQF